MRREIAVESTTLPEGAIISVSRVTNVTQKSESAPHTEISAAFKDDIIRMNLAHVSPNCLKPYLSLTVREINKQRDRIAKGEIKAQSHKVPKDFREFVQTMAAHEMFILR